MLAFVVRRLLATVPVALLVTIATFSFIHALPGDPVTALVGPSGTVGVDRAALQRRRVELGLNRPLPIQYVDWLGGVFRGDLGRSAVTRQPIREALLDRFPVTLQLAVAAFVVSLLLGLPAGILAAYHRGRLADRVPSAFALAGVAMPSFWFGILLILCFSVKLEWLPPSGFVSLTTNLREALKHLALPALALGTAGTATIMRQTRSSLLEVLGQDYVRTARAKGLTEAPVVLLHALPNALLSVVTVMGLQISRLLGGAVIIEVVFALPGIARYGVDAIFIHDYPVIQAFVLVSALLVVATNLATDLLYSALDPRIRYT